jgi:CrcB protein
MTTLALIACGGAFGAFVRYFVTSITTRTGRPSTTATWVVNLVGTFVLGFIVVLGVSHNLLLLLGVGFTGGLTTFSTFVLELVTMSPPARASRARYLVFTLLGGWLSALLGWALASWIIH